MSRDAAANSAGIRAVPIEFDAVPGHSRLFLSFLNGHNPDANEFWPNRSLSVKDYSSIALENYTGDRAVLCDALVTENEAYGATRRTLENIERLRTHDCVAVITGQQAGYLGGPAYTVYKALTAIRIAADLTTKGVNAVPVFWIATEDHDFEEISKAGFRGQSGTLVTGTIGREEGDNDLPVGEIRIGVGEGSVLDDIFSEIPHTQFTEDLRGLAADCYSEGALLGDAFGRLLTAILGDYGLIFVNPLNPTVRSLSSEVFRLTIERLEEIRSLLSERDKLLEHRGFHSQVYVSSDFIPLFVFDKEGKRKSLEVSGDDGLMVSKDRELEISRSNLLELASSEPARLSPSALLRPVVQDSIFPSACYIGGAAEVCYFAQNSVIYEALGRPATPILHRAAFTVFEARHRRTIEAYAIEIGELFKKREEVLKRLAEGIIDRGTLRLFEETSESLESNLTKMESALKERAPDVAQHLDKRREKVLWHIKALREKFVESEARKNADLTRRIDDLFDNTYPGGVLQERAVSFLDFLNIHGRDFTDWMLGLVDPGEGRHKAVFF